MSRLPRPDLRSGAHRDLVDALHDLHHRAGWPRLRTLANAAGCSPTTVSTVFSMPKLPSWGLVELLVEAMGGDSHEFHRLWLACGSAHDGTGSTTPRIAGRRSELAAVRRHLESGVGLLLVTGEAGIWDRLHRPHDAAYYRWRGAQAAIANGQGTIAAKLLRRAARDAREHVPLASVIAETAAYASQI